MEKIKSRSETCLNCGSTKDLRSVRIAKLNSSSFEFILCKSCLKELNEVSKSYV